MRIYFMKSLRDEVNGVVIDSHPADGAVEQLATLQFRQFVSTDVAPIRFGFRTILHVETVDPN